ncbi:hypothetical protein KEJ21_02160 [Candidatus Bathyarchaeota archaeon]|nr:hypothetical protein [Candidatus Bathyarchaeota archaeon]MBS7631081.1 hypothetical protein [Candidatus Bathyarchaeota archaeon]
MKWTILGETGRQAGWGDLIGGVVIVMRRVDTGESYVGEIPLEFFKEGVFEKKLYLNQAVDVICKGICALKVDEAEPIHLCTGYILSKAAEELRKQGYSIVLRKIKGETQLLAEREFVKSLVRLGVGCEEDVEKMRSFKSLLRWVMKDLERRERYVKTGWRSWLKYRKEGVGFESKA